MKKQKFIDTIVSYHRLLTNEVRNSLIFLGLIILWSIIFVFESLYKKEWIFFGLWIIISLLWGHSFYTQFKWYRKLKSIDKKLK